MKITLLSDFSPPMREVETHSTALGAFLEELPKEFGTNVPIFDPISREVHPSVSVTLNGTLWSALAEGMNTKLADGDRVAVYGTYMTGGG